MRTEITVVPSSEAGDHAKLVEDVHYRYHELMKALIEDSGRIPYDEVMSIVINTAGQIMATTASCFVDNGVNKSFEEAYDDIAKAISDPYVRDNLRVAMGGRRCNEH